MVGRPGRSEGCITCKKRRVKCDEAKPACHRCHKACIPCDGYRKTTIWVMCRPDDRRRSASEFSRSSSSPSRNEMRAVIPFCDPCSSSPCHDDTSHITRPPRTLSLNASQMNICISYTVSRLFPDSTSRIGSSQSWVLDACDADKTSTVYLATRCLSAAYFSHMQKLGPELQNAAIIYYGQALVQLRKNLNDPENFQNAENIGTVLILSLYEMTCMGTRLGLTHHAGGVSRLVETRGPEAHSSNPARTYFLLARLTIIYRALPMRQRTFLEDEAWTTIPWRGTCKSHLDVLIDIFARVPGHLQDSDELMRLQKTLNSTSSLEQKRQSLRCKLLFTTQQLFRWRWAWERLNPQSAVEVPSVLTTHDTSGENSIPLFDSAIHYHDLHDGARAITLYNTNLLFILDLAKSWNLGNLLKEALDTLHEECPEPSNPLRQPRPDLTTEQISEEICRSVDYQLQSIRAHNGSLHLIPPLRITAYYVQDARLKSWLERTMHMVDQACGFALSDKLYQNTYGALRDGGGSDGDSRGAGAVEGDSRVTELAAS